MKSKNFIESILDSLQFDLSDIRQTIKDFHSEMSKGLAGKKSSLAMIPTYASMPKGNETGRFIALDLGGTNFRILEVLLDGNGRLNITAENKFKLAEEDITGTGTRLFNFIADKIQQFISSNKILISGTENLGFTFSFPVKQTSISSGILPFWNKGFSAANVIGKDVVFLLNEALKRKRINKINISALLNDTVGTLAAKAYCDTDCDLGIILGTGTNACYPEKISNIAKLHGSKSSSCSMIINIEWGNFNKLSRTIYDRKIDNASPNPGRQRLEKLVSGMYIGEIGRVIFSDLAKKKILFTDIPAFPFNKPYGFETKYLSSIAEDNSSNLETTRKLLSELGISDSTYSDREIINKICRAVLIRSARISATAMSAVILWIDPKISRNHTIAIDGSLFEKCPSYCSHMEFVLRSLLKDKSKKITLSLAKDGSGIGAAVIAATASKV